MVTIPNDYQQQLEDAITGQLAHDIIPLAICGHCDYRWTAVVPRGVVVSECPECGENPTISKGFAGEA